MKPKVLIVEWALPLHNFYRQALEEKVELHMASTLEEGIEIFHQHSDFALIATRIFLKSDGKKEQIGSMPFIEELRRSGFEGPILVIASMYCIDSEKLERAGATGGCQIDSAPDEILCQILCLLEMDEE